MNVEHSKVVYYQLEKPPNTVCRLNTVQCNPSIMATLIKDQPLNKGQITMMQACCFELNKTSQEWPPLNSGHKSYTKGVAIVDWFIYIYIPHGIINGQTALSFQFLILVPK